MKKIWKILLWIGGAILLLFLIIVGITVKGIIEERSYSYEAINAGVSNFGGTIFNNYLSNCTPSYGGVMYQERWEIKGIENDKCISVYKIPMNYTYENNSASIEYLPVVLCEIPKEVYSNPKGLTEEFLINNGYCSFVNTDKWNASEVSNVQRVEVEENQDEGVTYWDISTLPEAQGNLFQGECVFWDSNLDLGECPEDLKVTDTAFEYKFFEACTNGKVSVCLNNNYVAGLDRQGKAPLKLVAFYDANKYGSQYQWKEFEI